MSRKKVDREGRTGELRCDEVKVERMVLVEGDGGMGAISGRGCRSGRVGRHRLIFEIGQVHHGRVGSAKEG
jgi:hypothetical protein